MIGMYVIYENDFGFYEVIPYFDVKVGLVREDRLLWSYERGKRKDFYRFDTVREATLWLTDREYRGYDVFEIDDIKSDIKDDSVLGNGDSVLGNGDEVGV